jgi:hypothetical protein
MAGAPARLAGAGRSAAIALVDGRNGHAQAARSGAIQERIADQVSGWLALMLISEAFRRPRISRPEIDSTVDPVAVFKLRCEARAYLYGEGELDLHDAVDELEAFARSLGINHKIGINGSQAIMADAFRPVREREWKEATPVAVDAPPIDETASGATPASTIEALLYVLRSGLADLNEWKNRERLSRCDAAAMTEIVQRLIEHWEWTPADIKQLIAMRKIVGGHQ